MHVSWLRVTATSFLIEQTPGNETVLGPIYFVYDIILFKMARFKKALLEVLFINSMLRIVHLFHWD